MEAAPKSWSLVRRHFAEDTEDMDSLAFEMGYHRDEALAVAGGLHRRFAAGVRDMAHQTFRGDAKYRNRRLMIGVKTIEQKRKPQKPMRRSRPTIPATRHSNKYAITSSTIIAV
jgi:hypothetical protein